MPDSKKLFDISKGKTDLGVVCRDYCEFSGESLDVVLEKVANSIELAKNEWYRIVKNCSVDEIAKYYCDSDYIYEILLAYCPERFNKLSTSVGIVNYVKAHVKGPRVMEFGGGTGQLCLMLHFNTDKDVTYVDVPSRIMDFAKWRFAKYGANINVVEVQVDRCELGEELYDCVVSDAVLEHVINLEETVQVIYRSLKPNGIFYLLFDPQTHNFPMHISAQKPWKELMRKAGFRQGSGRTWIKEDP